MSHRCPTPRPWRTYRVFRVQLTVTFSCPWQFIVTASSRKAIVANTHDAFVRIDDACTDLRRRIFRPHRRQKRHRHEIVIPRYGIVSSGGGLSGGFLVCAWTAILGAIVVVGLLLVDAIKFPFGSSQWRLDISLWRAHGVAGWTDSLGISCLRWLLYMNVSAR